MLRVIFTQHNSRLKKLQSGDNKDPKDSSASNRKLTAQEASLIKSLDSTLTEHDKVIEDMSDRELITNYCKWLSVSSETEKWSHILFEKVKTRNNACNNIFMCFVTPSYFDRAL